MMFSTNQCICNKQINNTITKRDGPWHKLKDQMETEPTTTVTTHKIHHH